MLQKFHTLKIATKFGVLIVSALICIMLLSVFSILSERTLLQEERQQGVRQAVETAHGVMTHFEALAQQGKMSEAAAKQGAIEVIRGLRYGGKEYFFIVDLQYKQILQPMKPEDEGKNKEGFVDPTGKPVFKEFVQAVKEHGSGYVHYMWPKPGSNTPVAKISWVSGFAPWGWVIGSGVYVDNIDETIMARIWQNLAATAAIGAVLLGICLFIARGLQQQLGGEPAYAATIAHSIASGDLSIAIRLAPGDQASLLHAMQTMRDGLIAIVQQIGQGTQAITEASADIAAGNADLSGRTESQASSLEQTSASMSTLTDTVKQNAESAAQANQLVISASNSALKGGEVVGNVVQTMASIKASSSKIVDIISVIDGIAFQTNILALNAAVEAARAGEEGRGFAVVASEVRSLAQRSANAAKEIKGLITASVEQVDAGSQLVHSAGSSMTEIVTSVQRVADIMAEITHASQEQSSGIQEVSSAIGHMDEMTQQNAALVEQAAAAAASMREQAQALSRVMSAFKLEAPGARPALSYRA